MYLCCCDKYEGMYLKFEFDSYTKELESFKSDAYMYM